MGNISANPLKSLTVNAKKNVRNMTFSSYYAHTAPIFRDLEILAIDQSIVHRIGTVMYKFNYGLLPDVLNTLYRNNCEIQSYNNHLYSLHKKTYKAQCIKLPICMHNK